MNVYLIGSLRNPRIPEIAKEIRMDGHTVFDDWFAAGPNADDHWRDYEKGRGHSYIQALDGYSAKHVFSFDLRHLDRAQAVVLALPAGKSGHLELGWALGRGKAGFVLLDNPERWDVMYQFANGVFDNLSTLTAALKNFELRRYHQERDRWLSDTVARRPLDIGDSLSDSARSASEGIVGIASSNMSSGGDNGR